MMINKYLGRFNEEGKPIRFLLEGVNYKTLERKEELIAQGWIELSHDEWEYYTNNRGYGVNGTGYIRDPKTGRPVSAPPHIYTKEELANYAYSLCQDAVSASENELVKAKALEEDPEYIQELEDEIAAAEELYGLRLEAIENGQATNYDEVNAIGSEEEEVEEENE